MLDSIMPFVALIVVIALFTLPQLWFISFTLSLKSMAWEVLVNLFNKKTKATDQENSNQ